MTCERLSRSTASFYKRPGDQVERVTVANSIRLLRYWMQVGESIPLHATSGGKAILASMPKSLREGILSRMKLTKATANTITSYSALRNELEATAKTGIAYSREKFEEGVISISVATLKRDNQPEGSLSVVFPTVRDKPAHRKVSINALRAGKAHLEAEIEQSRWAVSAQKSGKARATSAAQRMRSGRIN